MAEATCRRELDLEIPADEVTKAMERVAKEFARVARVPGFRPGKAPVSLIRRRFADDIKGEVVQSLVPERVEKAVSEQKLTPVSQPQVDKLDFAEGQPLKFRAVFEVLPEFELGNYKDLELEMPVMDVTDDDVLNGMGDQVIGTVTAHTYSAYHPSPLNKEYVAAMRKANNGMRANFMSVGGYDGMHLIYEALKKTSGATGGAEQYTYSIAWLAFGVALLGIGIVVNSQRARLASAVVIALTILKAFLIDMSTLTGVYRALSFMCLGLVLVAIGWLYQRILFRRRSMPPSAAVGANL